MLIQLIVMEGENNKMRSLCEQQVEQYKNTIVELEEKEKATKAMNKKMMMMIEGFQEGDQVRRLE